MAIEIPIELVCKILLEVKSFVGRSIVADFQAEIGQYSMYQNVIDEENLGFRLYLAISSTIYEERFQSPLAQLMVERGTVNLLVFDAKQEVVVQWIESTSIERS